MVFHGGGGVKRDEARAPKDQEGDETNRPDELERGTRRELFYGCRNRASNVTEGLIPGDALNRFLNLCGDV